MVTVIAWGSIDLDLGLGALRVVRLRKTPLTGAGGLTKYGRTDIPQMLFPAVIQVDDQVQHAYSSLENGGQISDYRLSNPITVVPKRQSIRSRNVGSTKVRGGVGVIGSGSA